MSLDTALLYSFLLVFFVRCSAMLLVFRCLGSEPSPQVRIYNSRYCWRHLTLLLPVIGPAPTEPYMLMASVLKEALAGLLIGTFMSLLVLASHGAGARRYVQMGFEADESRTSGTP